MSVFFLQKHEVSLVVSALLLLVAMFGTTNCRKNTWIVCALKFTFIKSLIFTNFYTNTIIRPFTHNIIQIAKEIYIYLEDHVHLEKSLLT